MKAGGDLDQAMRAVLAITIDDQRQADDRDDGKHGAIANHAEPRDSGGARITPGDEQMVSEEYHQTEYEDAQSHDLLYSICLRAS
jgi:hypothetical protein